MRMIADRIDALLADKGYDADAIRDKLASANIEAVIPAKSNRRPPPLSTTGPSTVGATRSSASSTS